ncbi:sporulation/spore germination protein [Clostridium fermenticellae]|uniref:Sporulation/spore germination protein n=1 Tax=Clostridium fermenticellae TaxID=2068654 RepID=A0A386H718_9CLOT|nr:GerMN domain-containing protein [Clostridium fermenticellae]AYD41315.1 sporulation/spore germination protein [Clostridium fermenticellae]
MKKTFCFRILFTVLVLSLLSGCTNKDLSSSNSKEKEKQIALSNEKGNTLDLDLYFNSSSSPDNFKISTEERIIKRDELLGEAIINELIKGPSIKSKLTPLLPKKSRLVSFSIKDGIAYINFSKETNVSMSYQMEKACIKSIILSLRPVSSIKKVKFYIEGKDNNMWGNHIDLSKPVTENNIDNSKI